MAIRPTDLQLSIVQSVQQPPLAARSEDASRNAQGAAQSSFIAQTESRQETVAQTARGEGNKIGLGEPNRDQQGGKRKRKRAPGDPFEAVVEEAAGSDEPPHLIDFSA